MKQNVFFLLIDSFRSDMCFGDTKTSLTPNIDSLIETGTLFPQTISCVASTTPSISSMFTGKFPFRIGMSDARYEKLDSSIPTYIEHFKNHGYLTFAATSGVASILGLDDDFELKLESSGHNNYYSLFDGLGEKILKKLQSSIKEPWFFYIHINDLHQPIIVPKDFDKEKFGQTDYERMVSAIDSWIGKFLTQIDKKKTIIVLSTDHGEYIRSMKINGKCINLESDAEEQLLWKMGNKIPPSLYGPKRRISSILHKIRELNRKKKIKSLQLSRYQKRVLTGSRMSAGTHVFDDVLKVPLIMSGSGISEHKIIFRQIGLIDIMPTITEILGLEPLNSKIDGTSLVPLFSGHEIDKKPLYIQSMPHISKAEKQSAGIRTESFKYFRDNDDIKNCQLFDLINDPLEEYDISSSNKELVSEMEGILQKYLDEKTDSHSVLDDDERKKVEDELKKLGYI